MKRITEVHLIHSLDSFIITNETHSLERDGDCIVVDGNLYIPLTNVKCYKAEEISAIQLLKEVHKEKVGSVQAT